MKRGITFELEYYFVRIFMAPGFTRQRVRIYFPFSSSNMGHY